MSEAGEVPIRVEVGGITFARIDATTFLMGSTRSEAAREADELRHVVTISRPFLIAEHEVTQQQWSRVMTNNPAYHDDPRRPVERVSWWDAVAFCEKLNELERAVLPDGMVFRLPTEAEWELACRGGTLTPTPWGDSLSSSTANFNGAYPYNGARVNANRQETVRPYKFRRNDFGLHDMLGNVAEWCHDWYGVYPASAVTDPTGPESGEKRVIRGGSWVSMGRDCRSAERDRLWPEDEYYAVGFRIVLGTPLGHVGQE
ncbi:MAG: formylglycine-generating enzyme family protein [Verrucomicrobia bacterium]|nr:formylglycine-generating enzyme family protein [Verrucomicrobiota bacterium]